MEDKEIIDEKLNSDESVISDSNNIEDSVVTEEDREYGKKQDKKIYRNIFFLYP